MKKITDNDHMWHMEIKRKENITIIICFFLMCIYTIDIHFLTLGVAFSGTWRTPYEDLITNALFISYPLISIVLMVVVIKTIFNMGKIPSGYFI